MNNKFFSLIIVSLFLISLASATDITNCTDLQGMANNLSGNYVVVNDIDCSDTVNWNNGSGFVAVGENKPATEFKGIFDGGGYTISNLYVSGDSFDGLFGVVRDAIVSNIKLVNITVNSSGNSAGGITGYLRDGGIIENCSVEGEIYSSSYGIGGLVGLLLNDGNITNSYFIGNVSGDYNVGGLVGYANSITINVSIMDSYAVANVSGNVSSSGGIMGANLTDVYCNNSYWNTDFIGVSACGEGKTTTELKNISTYLGWDIEANETDLNDGYPYLTFGVPVWYIYQQEEAPPEAPQQASFESSPIYQSFEETGAGLGVFIDYIQIPLFEVLTVLIIVIVLGAGIIFAFVTLIKNIMNRFSKK